MAHLVNGMSASEMIWFSNTLCSFPFTPSIHFEESIILFKIESGNHWYTGKYFASFHLTGNSVWVLLLEMIIPFIVRSALAISVTSIPPKEMPMMFGLSSFTDFRNRKA